MSPNGKPLKCWWIEKDGELMVPIGEDRKSLLGNAAFLKAYFRGAKYRVVRVEIRRVKK